MKPKLYILSFDPYLTDATKLHGIIITLPGTVDWWHYIGSAYLISSTSSAYTLQNHINTRWAGRFLLAQVEPSDTGGWLPQEAWDWINSKR